MAQETKRTDMTKVTGLPIIMNHTMSDQAYALGYVFRRLSKHQHATYTIFRSPEPHELTCLCLPSEQRGGADALLPCLLAQ